MARGSARQRKKIAKKLALQSVQTVQAQREQHIKPKPIKPVITQFDEYASPKTIKPKNISEVEDVTKIRATSGTITNKIKKLSRKKRKKLKLQQQREQQKTRTSRQQSEQYRGNAQKRYYEENPDKDYTNEAVDMTDEYANEVLNDISRLSDHFSNYLTSLFYSNYRTLGKSYIQTLHDSGIIEEIHEVVEYCVARYKGNLPEVYLKQLVEWLNNGLPVDARVFDTEDSEDIFSEYYE